MSEQPMERKLDGIFIKVQVEDHFETRCLTDCTWEQVTKWLRERASQAPNPHEYLIAVIHELHESLRKVGDQLNIVGYPPHTTEAEGDPAGEPV